MGYETNYDASANREEILNAIIEISDYNTRWNSDGTLNNAKWYNHNKHLITVSKKFPDDVIILEGEGEESGDIWKKYYKNGKVQVARALITFDEYDESKLK